MIWTSEYSGSEVRAGYWVKAGVQRKVDGLIRSSNPFQTRDEVEVQTTYLRVYRSEPGNAPKLERIDVDVISRMYSSDIDC